MRGFDSCNLGLLFCEAFLKDGAGGWVSASCECLDWDVLVFCFLLLLAVEPATVEGAQVTAALQADGGDKSLDLRSGKSSEHRTLDG